MRRTAIRQSSVRFTQSSVRQDTVDHDAVTAERFSKIGVTNSPRTTPVEGDGGIGPPHLQEHPVASTADDPEQPLVQARRPPSVDPSITPSAPRRQGPGVSAGQTRRKGGRRRSDNPHVQRSPKHRRTSTEPRRRELLQALGIFQRATPDQLWKLTRPDNQHDRLVRDNLLDLEEHQLVRIETVREDQRQVWVLTKRGHGEAKKLLEPKGIRISVLREEKFDAVTGKLLGTSYDDHAAAVTSTAAELHRAGIGHQLGFQTEIGHRLGNSFVQRADLVVRAPEAKVPVMLLEIDRRTEDAHDLVQKLRRYWEWGRLLPKDADKQIADRVRSRPDAIGHVDHEQRLWRRFYPPTGREGLVPLAFVFADTTEAKVDNTVAVLEETGRRYWAPRRYETYHRGITAKDYGQAVPVVVTTLEQLTEHGADAAVWRRLGRTGEQKLTAALDIPVKSACRDFRGPAGPDRWAGVRAPKVPSPRGSVRRAVTRLSGTACAGSGSRSGAGSREVRGVLDSPG
ncbi:replication-relaxation family protein [Streptomyces sp. 21So2-11]|uniref:replication-relaxation family protein n=1 Tax=Streptomyces sp. 21So2-11 TaxID=3144408 RepID=UPI00321BA379